MTKAVGWMLAFVSGVVLAVGGLMYHYNLFPSLEVRAAKSGKLEGKLIVQWLEPDKFLFIPDAASPLKFTRSTGEVVQPQRLATDGGTIPRPMWVARSYSPWGFAPAFIVHDWLFEMKRCKIAGSPAHDYKAAALIMAEVIKTMAAAGVAQVDDLTLVSMHAAVSSSYAKDYWENGVCETRAVEPSVAAPMPAPSADKSVIARVPATASRSMLEAKRPVMQYEIKF